MFWDDEYILELVLSVLTKIHDMGANALDYADKTNPQLLSVVDNIADYAVKPLASVLFALFAVMQIYKIMSLLNDSGAPQGGSARYETMGFALLKIGFIYWLITSMSNVMWGLVSAGNWLMEKVKLHGSYKGAHDFTVLEDKIREMLQDKGLFQKFAETMGVNLNLSILGLAVQICELIIFILFYARLMQIFVMMALSPIPIVTLIHDEHKQIGIAFIKSFAAVVLQGAVMVAIIYIYSHVITYSMTNATSLTGMIWHAAGYGILLVVALATSGSVAKKIINAI